jgi:hypothetical protein
MSKCPHCDAPFRQVSMQQTVAQVAGGKAWHATSFCCPNCDAALSISIDHVAFGNEIAAKVIDEIRRQSPK